MFETLVRHRLASAMLSISGVAVGLSLLFASRLFNEAISLHVAFLGLIVLGISLALFVVAIAIVVVQSALAPPPTF